MKSEERRKLITEIVKREGRVTLSKLHESMPEISEITLRRDLDVLDKKQKLVRIRGGAKSLESILNAWEDPYANRMVSNAEEKLLIAQKAVKLLSPKTSIYLDSGSTAFSLASIIPDEEYIITTTGITCALELSKLNRPIIQMPGGIVNKNSFSLNGNSMLPYLSDMNFNIAFIGVTGYIPGKRFVTGIPEDYMLKKTVVKNSRRVVILMDSSKVGILGTYTIAELEEVDTVISDDKLDAEVAAVMERRGVKVL